MVARQPAVKRPKMGAFPCLARCSRRKRELTGERIPPPKSGGISPGVAVRLTTAGAAFLFRDLLGLLACGHNELEGARRDVEALGGKALVLLNVLNHVR